MKSEKNIDEKIKVNEIAKLLVKKRLMPAVCLNTVEMYQNEYEKF